MYHIANLFSVQTQKFETQVYSLYISPAQMKVFLIFSIAFPNDL